jgi:hypothetical protein
MSIADKPQTDTFAYIGRGRKLHFTFRDENGTLVSACTNAGGDWIGKPVTAIAKTVEYLGAVELDDQNRAYDALRQIRPWITEKDICWHCWKARIF